MHDPNTGSEYEGPYTVRWTMKDGETGSREYEDYATAIDDAEELNGDPDYIFWVISDGEGDDVIDMLDSIKMHEDMGLDD